MAQIIVEIDEKFEAQINELAYLNNMTNAEWLVSLIKQRLNQEWSPEILALSGSWTDSDFPSLEQIRSSSVKNSIRQPL